jgi:hypothetical protein
MRPDGSYERVRPREGEAVVDAQARLLAAAASAPDEHAGR